MPTAKPVDASAWLKRLPEERRAAITALRKLIREHLPAGYQERFDGRMLAYEVPLSIYPDTYNRQPLLYLALASMSGHMALYMCNAAADEKVADKLRKMFARADKRLDMGKACVRFKKLDDLALDAVATAVAATPMKRYIALSKAVHSPEAVAQRRQARRASRSAAAS